MIHYVMEKEISKKSLIRYLRQAPLFKGLTEAECSILCDELAPTFEEYKRDAIIIHEGEEETDIGIVISGSIRSEKFHMEGEIHLVDMHEQGEIISLDNVSTESKISPVTFVAASEEAVILAINGDRLLTCSYRNIIMRNIINILGNESIKKLYKIDVLSHAGMRDRVLTYLRIMSQKHGGGSFHIMMTQNQLANYLSVNRSALSNELNKMRREGILDFKKDKYILLNK